MRTVSFISIILACLIISLHDIIPHYHQAELQKEQSEHNDLWEFLQDLFLVDLGYEHLESYMSQKSQNLKLIDFESDLTLMQTTLINVEVRFLSRQSSKNKNSKKSSAIFLKALFVQNF